ncbi:30S ribosomal protein S11 [Candidatus Collierbacteria bacterium CG17_big_fil_post_rev_8_21_14_2_50_45_7]|uniref:Small ribosomal subunit protein uS11 n=1 Tax=Candidatus Collierbacteria bacterium CG17_big_fil_post_rev_8_21_14_2_50_45_7 TaxID=1974536 RepID=A0A2M7FS63_9BACT|nr:MAG: 30S ribosomal protein S11 [Candidatus Collierbacteria bacterium CG17_big_fil_post_rev_8_21_14_2_50_45_7]
MAISKNTKTLTEGRIYILATFNNTVVTITDTSGNVVAWSSTGKVGFKGSRKSTPFAATQAVTAAVDTAKGMGLRQAAVYIKGPGPGRDAALRVLRTIGIKVTEMLDVTPIPHNGTRAKKPRHG